MILLWIYGTALIGKLYSAIHKQAPGLMIGLVEAGASFFLFPSGGLRWGIAIVLAVAGFLDIGQGIKHLLFSETDY